MTAEQVETNQPTISTGSSATTSAVIRTTLQAFSPAIIIQGLQVFNVWHPSADQTQWLMAVGTPMFTWLQWQFEKARSRKLIGKSV